MQSYPEVQLATLVDHPPEGGTGFADSLMAIGFLASCPGASRACAPATARIGRTAFHPWSRLSNPST